MCVCVCGGGGGGVTGGAQIYMLGAKCGFAPSADFVAQSLDLGFAQISTDSAVEPRIVPGTISY